MEHFDLRFRILVVLAICGAAVALGGCSLFTCGNEVVARATSPDAAIDAVLFQRDCGTTTAFSTQVCLVPAGREIPSDPVTVFAADCGHGAAPAAAWGGPPAEIEWRGNRDLVVRFHRSARVFRSKHEVDV